MEKYKFENNKAVVDLQCIITISKSSVSIEHAGSTDTEDIPDAGLTILVGNIESYNPTPINTEPVPEVNPTQPDNPGGSGEEPGGDTPGGDTPGEDTPVTPDPIPSGNGNITFRIVNDCGHEVRLSGEAILNIYNSPTASSYTAQVNVNWFGEHSAEWTNNSLTIPVGGMYEWSSTIDSNYLNGNYYIQRNNNPYSASSPNYISPLFIYSKYYSKSKLKEDLGNGMYFTNIRESCKLQPNQIYIFTIYNMRAEAMLADTNTTVSTLNASGKSYAILYKGQTSLPRN